MGSVALYPALVLVWEDNRGVGLTYPIDHRQPGPRGAQRMLVFSRGRRGAARALALPPGLQPSSTGARCASTATSAP
jgi:hypothetical protein